MLSGFHVFRFSRFHVFRFSGFHVFMFSCFLFSMLSWCHVLMFSCFHVLRFSCFHVFIFPCHCVMFTRSLNEWRMIERCQVFMLSWTCFSWNTRTIFLFYSRAWIWYLGQCFVILNALISHFSHDIFSIYTVFIFFIVKTKQTSNCCVKTVLTAAYKISKNLYLFSLSTSWTPMTAYCTVWFLIPSSVVVTRRILFYLVLS